MYAHASRRVCVCVWVPLRAHKSVFAAICNISKMHACAIMALVFIWEIRNVCYIEKKKNDLFGAIWCGVTSQTHRFLMQAAYQQNCAQCRPDGERTLRRRRLKRRRRMGYERALHHRLGTHI